MATILSSYMKNPTPPFPGKRFKYSGQSVRSLPMRIITIGKKRSKGIQLLVEEYKGKLKYYCRIDDIQIKSNPKNTSDVKAQVEGEDAIVMQHIRSADWVVLLDEHGLDIGSEKMAELVGDAGQTGSSALTFCIGGPYGHGQRLHERANVTIRLSSLVLNHHVALIVLLEQLYRCCLFDLEHGLFSKDRNTITSTNTPQLVISKQFIRYKPIVCKKEIEWYAGHNHFPRFHDPPAVLFLHACASGQGICFGILDSILQHVFILRELERWFGLMEQDTPKHFAIARYGERVWGDETRL